MKYLLDLDMDKCISCGACAVACMDQHDTNLEHGDPALRWVTRLERQQGERVAFLGLSMACMHCNDAPCVTGCPVGCLHKDPETGMTVATVVPWPVLLARPNSTLRGRLSNATAVQTGFGGDICPRV